MEHPPTNIRRRRPSRKRLHPGDVFSMQLPDDSFLTGRVISTDAQWTIEGNGGPAILYYIYRVRTHEQRVPERSEMKTDKLLIPPGFINHLPWGRGYFETLANVPLADDEVLSQHCFRRSDGSYYDERARRLAEPVPPVGRFALQSYRTLDDKVSGALGLPLAPP